MFVTQEEFTQISKGKKVVSFPNPLIKEVDGVRYEIMTPQATCSVSAMPHDDYEWYIGASFEEYQRKVKELYGEENSEIIVISTNTKAGYHWFPTELVCGTIPVHIGAGIMREKFSIKTELAQKTGCMLKGENAGSFECYFRSSKVNEAIRILRDNHWKCPWYNCVGCIHSSIGFDKSCCNKDHWFWMKNQPKYGCMPALDNTCCEDYKSI